MTARAVAAEAVPPRFNPFDAAFRADPHPVYRQLRATAPVHRTLGTWIVTGYDDVRALLRDRTLSVAGVPERIRAQAARLGHDDAGRIGRLADRSLVFTDDPAHGRLRSLVGGAIGPAAIEALRPQVEAWVTTLLGQAPEDGFDVVADLARPLPLTVLADWMALPEALRARVGAWTHAIRFLLEPGLMRAGDLEHAGEAVEALTDALAALVGARGADPGDDLISRLAAARTRDRDALTDEEVGFAAVMCFVAGHETTSSLIGTAVRALLLHPDQWALLRRRPDLAGAAVTEALRFDSPLQMTTRTATADLEVGGRTVRAGDQLVLCLGAANRDPAAYDEPDEFRIARRGPRHVALGHGMHACVGGLLAALQASVALERLARGPDLALTGDPAVWQDHSTIVRGLRRLPVVTRRPPP